jgi:hypothetical protein
MYVVSAMTANAAPLANGTVLKITSGNSSGGSPCTSGSCIGWSEISWRNISPGTDGGFIVGKSQVSGGQEINGSLATPGELTAAGPLAFNGQTPATLYTLPDGGTANVFNDASCTQEGCLGITTLNTLNIAWGGQSIQIGSAVGCTHLNCTVAQRLLGIFVNSYTIDLVGNTWSMDYSQVVPSGPWTGVPVRIILRGTVILPSPNCPVVDYALQSPNTQLIVVFGSKLTGATEVLVNGIKTTVFGVISDDILWAFIPSGVTLPWKPGTVQVSNAGCAGSFPKPCGT